MSNIWESPKQTLISWINWLLWLSLSDLYWWEFYISASFDSSSIFLWHVNDNACRKTGSHRMFDNYLLSGLNNSTNETIIKYWFETLV